LRTRRVPAFHETDHPRIGTGGCRNCARGRRERLSEETNGNVTQTSTKTELEARQPPEMEDELGPESSPGEARAKAILRLRFLWNEKGFLGRAAVAGLLFGTLLAFLLPKRFESTTRLMPPDTQSSSGLAMMAGLMAKTGDVASTFGGDLLGLKSTGAQFVGILRSRTVEDRLVERFNLKKVYWVRWDEDARQKLEEKTGISEDRKSGIITITVTDSDPKRAAAIAQAYVEELDHLVAELSTSAAHRERVFLDERLKVIKLDLDQASKEFSQFASK